MSIRMLLRREVSKTYSLQAGRWGGRVGEGWGCRAKVGGGEGSFSVLSLRQRP